MSTATTDVVTNGIVVCDSPLPEGAKVEVVVVQAESLENPRLSMLDFLETLPSGPHAFKSWEEYEQHLREEKDSWER